MALGEAQVIAQTKAALTEQGVAVEVLEAAAAASGHSSANKAVARSPNTLLVKNLPYRLAYFSVIEYGRVGTSGGCRRPTWLVTLCVGRLVER